MLDILAFGTHPDDCEIFMGGTLAAMKAKGYRVGVCDLTRGEAGTYGIAETRKKEMEKATEILGLDARVTLDLPDGNVRNTEENRLKLVDVIRRYRPTIVFASVETTRHPDHSSGGALVKDAAFLAGLKKIETEHRAFRPSRLIRYPELSFNEPDFVVDITDFWHKKAEAIHAYATQVVGEGEDDTDTETFVRSHAFREILEAANRFAGSLAGVKYAEPFFVDGTIVVNDIMEISGKNGCTSW